MLQINVLSLLFIDYDENAQDYRGLKIYFLRLNIQKNVGARGSTISSTKSK